MPTIDQFMPTAAAAKSLQSCLTVCVHLINSTFCSLSDVTFG